MVLSDYSIFYFGISFNIPVNNSFTSIVIKDPLTRGLNYTMGQAEIYVNDSTAPITSGYSNTSTTDSSTGLSTLILTITNPEIIQPNVKTAVTIKFPVLVTNIDSLIETESTVENFNNTATISAFINDVNASEINAISPLSFSKFVLYGFGSSRTIDRIPGTSTIIIASNNVVDSSTNPNLLYRVTVSADNAITILENLNNIYVIAGNNAFFVPFTIETLTDGVKVILS